MKHNSNSPVLRIVTWLYCAIYLLGLLEQSAGISSRASETSTALWYEAPTACFSAVFFLVAVIFTFLSEKWAAIPVQGLLYVIFDRRFRQIPAEPGSAPAVSCSNRG